MNITCVVLNYQDEAASLAQLKRLCRLRTLSSVVLVDNASADGSAERLRAALPTLRTSAGPKLYMLRARHNGGYGSGNDLGIRYACSRLGAEAVLVANPDTVFGDELVRALGRALERRPSLGVVGALMRDRSRGQQAGAWPLRSWSAELLHSMPLLRRVFRRALQYPDSYLHSGALVPVEVVHGSLLMIRSEAYIACGGYDPAVFLYAEENILARRMQAAGYRTALCNEAGYRHRGSASISRAHGATARQRLRQRSERLYYRKYLHIGPLRRLLTRAAQAFSLAETFVAERMGLL